MEKVQTLSRDKFGHPNSKSPSDDHKKAYQTFLEFFADSNKKVDFFIAA